MAAALTEITLENVGAGYGGTQVVEDISFTARRGRRLGLLGRNGAGKTTVLATMMGQTNQLAGAVLADGRDISRLPAWRRARLGLGLVPQTRDIFPSLSVEENLLAGLRGGPRRRLDQAWALFPRLRERRGNLGNQLSGGEQQMLSVARALMGAPSILLLDEPLEGLAPLIAEELMAAIGRLAEETGIGCVLVEQHVDLVLDFADDALVLERGRIAYAGSCENLRAQPAVLERAIGLSAAER